LSAVKAIGIDWEQANEAAMEWARTYTYDLVTGINATTRDKVSTGVQRFFADTGRTRGDLEADLAPWFGSMRAEMIAVTEVTRASAEGAISTVQIAKDSGFDMVAIWHTNRDELVCTTMCAPLDDKPEDEWAELTKGLVNGPPPAHPRCRCWITHRWNEPEAQGATPAASNAEIKQEGERWAQSLSQPEELAVKQYTEAAARMENRGLREGRDPFPDLTKRLDAALDKSRTPAPTTAYRTSGAILDKDFNTYRWQDMVGQTVRDPAYLSTSLSEQAARSYGSEGDALIEIQVPEQSRAAYVGAVGQHPEEQELLIARGSGLEIVSAQLRNNIWQIVARLIQ